MAALRDVEMIDAGADIQTQDASGKTALIWASRLGYAPAVAQLIGAGADLDTVDVDGYTALMDASRWGE